MSKSLPFKNAPVVDMGGIHGQIVGLDTDTPYMNISAKNSMGVDVRIPVTPEQAKILAEHLSAFSDQFSIRKG